MMLLKIRSVVIVLTVKLVYATTCNSTMANIMYSTCIFIVVTARRSCLHWFTKLGTDVVIYS